jgi:hypothetical protein
MFESEWVRFLNVRESLRPSTAVQVPLIDEAQLIGLFAGQHAAISIACPIVASPSFTLIFWLRALTSATTLLNFLKVSQSWTESFRVL